MADPVPVTVVVWERADDGALTERVTYDGPGTEAADAAVASAQDAYRAGVVEHMQVITHRYRHVNGVCTCVER